mgnify:CR=1 FL=1
MSRGPSRRPATARDHPRSRGVYAGASSWLCPATGSSPLARGLHGLVEGQGVVEGIIPARAGFTSSASILPLLESGSSPLARGLRLAEYEPIHADGIIPARAGFTRGGPLSVTRLRDHPRSRGVYAYARADFYLDAGSSPLARGLPDGNVGTDATAWIIPARAGFTPVLHLCPELRQDHPRSRGVYRGRGAFQEPKQRIIPARAGFT